MLLGTKYFCFLLDTIWYPSSSLYVCIYVYVRNAVGPAAHFQAAQQEQPIAGQARTTQLRHGCIFISAASAERHLPEVARKPQGGVLWEHHLAVTEVFPHMCLPACCPLSSETSLLWCNIMVKEHNMSSSVLVACQVHAYFQARHLSSLEAKQAWKGIMAGFHPVETPLLGLYLALLALIVLHILEH